MQLKGEMGTLLPHYAQKQYLLIDKFGISADTINNMLKDPHYK